MLKWDLHWNHRKMGLVNSTLKTLNNNIIFKSIINFDQLYAFIA